MKSFIKVAVVFLFLSSTVFGLTYTVKRGDSIDKIARKFGVSVKDIIKANNIKKPYIIYPGQKLKIPVKKTKKKKATPKVKKSRTTLSQCSIIHTVRPGDSLIKIAKKYKVYVKDIKRLNNLKSNLIVVGQKLCIKRKKTQVKSHASSKPKYQYTKKGNVYIKREKRVYKRIITYRVKKGDSLYKIAKKFNMSVRRLMQLNGLKRNSVILPGQKLKVEKKEVVYIEKVIKSKVDFGFIWPAEGKIHPVIINKSAKRYAGIDIETECLAPVKASEDGKVVFAGKTIKQMKDVVIIRHANKFTTAYGYLDSITVKPEQIVKKGQIIGYAGKIKGFQDKCGVHFEIRKDDAVLNPLLFLEKNKNRKGG